MTTWNVVVLRNPNPITLGQVEESTESLARCAALSKYGISEDEYYDAENNGSDAIGISPGDDFMVVRN